MARHLLSLEGGEAGELPPQTVAIYVCVCFLLVVGSGLFAGLTLGLISIDPMELQVLVRSGSPKQQRLALACQSIITDPHWLLATLLLCNAGCFEALPIFLGSLINPIGAILISITLIVFFGEILPQAICARHGMAIGAAFGWPVRILMWATCPITYPLARSLDWLLGREGYNVFKRTQLKVLVDLHHADEGLGGKLSNDEVQIICGALDLTNKIVFEAMTPLHHLTMLSTHQRLDRKTIAAILQTGHSRLPVYAGNDRNDIVGLVLVKEILAHAFPAHNSNNNSNSDEAGVEVSALKLRPLPTLPASTRCYDMLKLFRSGAAHMVLLTQPRPEDLTPQQAHRLSIALPGPAQVKAAVGKGPSTGTQQQEAETPSWTRVESMQTEDMQTEEGDEGDSTYFGENSRMGPQQPGLPRMPGALAGSLGNHDQSLDQTITPFADPTKNLGLDEESAGERDDAARSVGWQAQPLPSVASTNNNTFTPQSSRFGPAASQRQGLSAQSLQHNLSRASVKSNIDDPDLARSSTALSVASEGRPRRLHSHGGHALAPELKKLPSGLSVLTAKVRTSLRGFSSSGAATPSDAASATGVDGHSDEEGEDDVVIDVTVPDIARPGQPIGIITLEDVLEELMGQEILDETDHYADNERTQPAEALRGQLAQSLPERLRSVVLGNTTHVISGIIRRFSSKKVHDLGGTAAPHSAARTTKLGACATASSTEYQAPSSQAGRAAGGTWQQAAPS